MKLFRILKKDLYKYEKYYYQLTVQDCFYSYQTEREVKLRVYRLI